MSSVTYNARGQVTAWTHGRFQDLPCAYDPVGNPVVLTDQLATSTFTSNNIIPNTRRFAYDPRYRLVGSTGKRHKNATDGVDAPVTPAPAATDYLPYTHRYSYDAVGNFTTNQEYSKSAVKYKAGLPDRFDGVGAENYGYDANGCVTSTPRHTSIGYQFDAQPTLIDLGGGGKIRLRRHGDQRVVRFRSATNAIRITLGAFEYEKTAGYTKVILHLEGPAGRCAQVERLATGTDSTSLPVFHVHGDHLGSGQALTKADATLLCQEEFFAYGRSSDRRDARNRYRFLGVERDEDTGLCVTGPRTYDPIVGRFLQGDPVVGGAAYVYSRGNPLTRLDDNGYADDLAADPILPPPEGWFDPQSVLQQPGGPPDTVNLGAFGAALQEQADNTPVANTYTGNPAEVGSNLMSVAGRGGLAIGPGHQGEPETNGGRMLPQLSMAADVAAVREAGARPRLPYGWFHRHPNDTGMSRKDVEHIVNLPHYGDRYTSIMQNTSATGGVVMAVTGAETKKLPYGGPSDYTPEQLAFVLDKLTGGKSAVYSGDSLTGDLTRVSGNRLGLTDRFVSRLEKQTP